MTKDVLKAIKWMIKETEREKTMAEFDEITKMYIKIWCSLIRHYMKDPNKEQYDVWLFNYPTDKYKPNEVEEFTITKNAIYKLISMFEADGFECKKYIEMMGEKMPNHYAITGDKIDALINAKKRKKK